MIRDDSQVILHLTVRVEGELVHTTKDETPLDCALGQGTLVPGLEAALIGMKAGETKETSVAPEQAFGERNPEAVRKFPRDAFGQIDSLTVGDAIRGTMQDQPFTAFVKTIEEEEVTLDFNHPLAGKTIDFEVEVVEVK